MAKKKQSKKTTKTRKKAAKKTVTKKTASKKTAAKKASKKKTAGKKTSNKKVSAGTVATDAGIKPYEPRKGEEYMNEDQREHFRQILMAWKRDLMEEVDRTVHHMQDEAANFPDPSDRATQESEFSLELRARDRERKLIKKIDESLQALKEDDYGFCHSCGIEIGIRRLEARPTATLCIDCKTLDEIREKQMIG
ncbi:DnaK suppressor protein [Natronospira proteinivora]|uniref:RNA polymerase-binding transcription factor DksA n=1 Tax=Natronospira proteinivora TaxID=1807133 RepID=A0ABT1G6N3_9GAMM|nr:DnaK suppressor protein [Natronospira proteinivora]